MTVVFLLFSIWPLWSRLSERSWGVTLPIAIMRFHFRIANFDLWVASVGLGPDSQELTHKPCSCPITL